MCSAGTQTAALLVGGYAGTANLNTTEEYDGTTWTAGGTLIADKSIGVVHQDLKQLRLWWLEDH
jgi:hypothetical protein